MAIMTNNYRHAGIGHYAAKVLLRELMKHAMPHLVAWWTHQPLPPPPPPFPYGTPPPRPPGTGQKSAPMRKLPRP
jgi:hypothetical protein